MKPDPSLDVTREPIGLSSEIEEAAIVGGDPAPVDAWVCGPLHIEAQTFDGIENNFGRMLRFKNTAGKWPP